MVRRRNRKPHILVPLTVLLAIVLLGSSRPQRTEEREGRFSTEVVKADLSIEVELAGIVTTVESCWP